MTRYPLVREKALMLPLRGKAQGKSQDELTWLMTGTQEIPQILFIRKEESALTQESED